MIQSLKGPNFSGKTSFLQSYSQFKLGNFTTNEPIESSIFHDNRKDLYLGPIPSNFFTGIFGTVKEEIYRYKPYDDRIIQDFIHSLSLEYLYYRNPFYLSGGEQSLIAALSFATANPKCFCIDSTLEQLGSTWKESLLNCLVNFSIPEIIIADNRINEIKNSLTEIEYKKETKLIDSDSFRNLNSDVFNCKHSAVFNSIDLKDFCFSYGNNSVFKNFNLQFQSGKIYHLKGINGSGKSTLSKILCGVLKAAQNGMFLNGFRLVPYRHPGKYVGYSYQLPDDQLFSTIVWKELGLNKATHLPSELNSAIDAFGFADLLEKHPFDLPLSMRKRLALAATLINDRPFYILDEPTLFLDDFNVAQLKIIIEKLAESGRCVVVVSHSNYFISLFNHIETIDITKT